VVPISSEVVPLYSAVVCISGVICISGVVLISGVVPISEVVCISGVLGVEGVIGGFNEIDSPDMKGGDEFVVLYIPTYIFFGY